MLRHMTLPGFCRFLRQKGRFRQDIHYAIGRRDTPAEESPYQPIILRKIAAADLASLLNMLNIANLLPFRSSSILFPKPQPDDEIACRRSLFLAIAALAIILALMPSPSVKTAQEFY